MATKGSGGGSSSEEELLGQTHSVAADNGDLLVRRPDETNGASTGLVANP